MSKFTEKVKENKTPIVFALVGGAFAALGAAYLYKDAELIISREMFHQVECAVKDLGLEAQIVEHMITHEPYPKM